MWTSALWHHPILPLQWGAVIGASLAASAMDIFVYRATSVGRIPLWLTASLFLSGLVQAMVFCGPAGLLDSFLGALMVSSPYLVLFVLGGGGGDAKLMGGVGAWLGVSNGVIVLLTVTISGAIIGLIFAAMKNRLKSVFANLNAMVLGLMSVAYNKGGAQTAMLNASTHEKLPIPYGLSIFVGTCLALGGRLLWPV